MHEQCRLILSKISRGDSTVGTDEPGSKSSPDDRPLSLLRLSFDRLVGGPSSVSF